MKVLGGSHSGQTLLVVVLMMVVALTVSLSVVLRSVSNVRTSTDEENSSRAFSAAEAGLELALKTGGVIGNQTLDNSAVIKGVITQALSGDSASGYAVLVNAGNPVEKNDGADVWLIEHKSDGSLDYDTGWQNVEGENAITLYWGPYGPSADECNNAGLEVVVLTGSQAAPAAKRYAWDPCSARRAQNKFTDPTHEYNKIQDQIFYEKATFEIKNNSRGLLVRVTPLYKSSVILAKGCKKSGESCAALPSQGTTTTSTGEAGASTRKIVLYQGYPKVPSEIFSNTLFVPASP